MQPDYWNDAKKHLRAKCPTMKRLIAQYAGESLRARGDGFYTLVRSVVGQQISVKAADAVWAKVAAAVVPMQPHALLALSDEALRACGLSASKVAYAKNVADFFVERGIGTTLTSPFRGEVGAERRVGVSSRPYRHTPTRPAGDLPPEGGGKGNSTYWDALTDDEAIAQLTSIKGIGTWTAEMFLIFHLLRPNIFPVKDLGVLKAINLHMVDAARLGDKKWLTPKEYEAIAATWAPYRTVATWYLWRSLDPVPVEY